MPLISSSIKSASALTSHKVNDNSELRQEPSGLTKLSELSSASIAAAQTAACSVHQLIQASIATQPDCIALQYGKQAMSYAELDTRANGLAHRLREMGIGRDVPVGLALERSFDMLVAVLAVLKAGGAYVPLDPAYPPQRLAYMLDDCGAPVLLTQSRLVSKFPPAEGLQRLCLDEPGVMPAPRTDAPEVEVSPHDLAYVIYTSGSTGQPKGVAMPHGPLVNLITWQRSSLAAESASALPTLQYTSLSFDVSFQEIFATWAEGGTLHLIDEYERRDSQALLDFIISQGIGRLFLPFVALDGLCQAAMQSGRVPTSLKRVITAGEQLRVSPAVVWLFSRLDAVLHNQYGPSETHVVSEHRLYPPASEWPALPPIGSALPNVSLRVLDEHLQSVPVDFPGELYLGGDCVARGYLGREALTAERFLADPFQAGGRLYKTGDLVRRRADGALDFLGRIDQQVKLRGFRIELGEIESAIASHPAVQEVAVLVQVSKPAGQANDQRLSQKLAETAGEQLPATDIDPAATADSARLLAFVVPAPGQTIPDIDTLRDFLQQRLPDYMLPAACVGMLALPRTPSGKLDRLSLANPVLQANSDTAKPGQASLQEVQARRTAPKAATTELQARLLAAWQVELKRNDLGTEDNFFHAGGHSLDAARLRNRLQTELGISLGLRDIFEAPTVAALADRLRQLEQPFRSEQRISRQPRTQALPMSLAQRGLWLLEQIQGPSAIYNVVVPIRLQGSLNIPALHSALNDLVQRHEVLRSRLGIQGDIAAQWVAAQAGHSPENALALPQEDWRSSPDPAAAVQTRIAELSSEHFDLGQSAPLRLHLLWQADQDWTLVLNIHHAAFDGWSLGLWMQELEALYTARLTGQPDSLPALPVQYADFAVWEQQWFEGPAGARELAYWRERLGGVNPRLNLPTSHPRPPRPSRRGGQLVWRLESATWAAIHALARQEGATLFMVLLTVWAALLARLSQQQDFIVGTSMANRLHPETDGLIGLFTNTVALRMNLAGAPDLNTLLSRVKQVCLEAQDHQALPLGVVVEAMSLERDLSREALVQVLFVMQNNALPVLQAPGLRGVAREAFNGMAKLDLMLSATEEADGLELCLEYALDLFTPAFAGGLAEQYGQLLEQALAHPERPLPLFRTMPSYASEPTKGGQAAADQQTIHQLFSESAARRPASIALRWQEQAMTYAELDAQANGLAHRLCELGIGRDVPVGLALERSFDMLVAMLAVLKAGGAYVPLDPAYPPHRLAYMLDDCAAPVLLTHLALADKFPAKQGLQRLCLDEPGVMPAPRTDAPEVEVLPHDLAYVIYTSGSTGQPKGVAMEHAPVCNLLNWQRNSLAAEDADGLTTLQYTSLSFDVSVQEIFSTLVEGGTLHLIDEYERRDSEALLSFIIQNQIERLFLPFVALDGLCHAAMHSGRVPQHLRRVMSAGEQLRVSPALSWLFSRLEAVLHNQYGPTESCVIVSDGLLRPPVSSWPTLPPIGWPIQNVNFWVMDEQGQPVTEGEVGELWHGGACLARGYLGREALTAERFVPHPFLPGERLYRSGDLVRRGSDGAYEMLGRIDQQVKLRGYRIELGEVEAAVASHPVIREVAVLVRHPAGLAADEARNDGADERQLVAYVNVAPGEAFGTVTSSAALGALLRPYLRERLPEYMLPDAFVLIEALPRSASGKVDRKALPTLSVSANTSQASSASLSVHGEPDADPGAAQAQAGSPTEPEDSLEAQVLAVWREVIGQPNLGVHDNFFDAGGHSLSAARLRSHLQEKLRHPVALRTIFEAPTVQALSRRLRAAMSQQGELPVNSQEPALLARDRTGTAVLPLSFAQLGIWLADQIQGSQGTYNVPLALEFLGDLNLPALTQALTDLIRRHEILRTRIIQVEDQPRQHIDPAPTVPLLLALTDLRQPGTKTHNTSSSSEPADATLSGASAATASPLGQWLAQTSAMPLDLAVDGPLRLHLAQAGDAHWLLLINLHHAAVDGWSNRVLLRELQALYAAALVGQPEPLPPLELQFADFAWWQRQRLSDSALRALSNYWCKQLKGAPQVLELPADHPRPQVPSRLGAFFDFTLGAEITTSISARAQAEQATPFMLLLAVWGALLSRYSGQQDLLVGSPVANRPHHALEPLIGMFVNTLALRLDLSAKPGLRALLAQVRNTCLDAFAHQELPFEQVVEALQVERQLAHEPLCQVLFVMQDNEQLDADWPDLETHLREWHNGTAKYDLVLNMSEHNGCLQGRLEYALDLFTPQRMQAVAGHFKQLLTAALAEPDRPLARLPLLTPEEALQFDSWNKTARPLLGRNVQSLFAEVAEKQPHAVAVQMPGVLGEQTTLTFAELDARANSLAHELCRLGVGANVPVAVALERGPDQIATLLAILKAGGAYVPLDPTYPSQRLAYMLKDCGAGWLLTQSSLATGVLAPLLASTEEHRIQHLLLDWPGVWPVPRPDAPPVNVQPNDLAYLNYTSGSTGQPKGVAVPHQAVLRLVDERIAFSIGPQDVVLQFAPVAFDAATLEIWGALLNGARLAIHPPGLPSPANLAQFLVDQQVSFAWLTAALFHLMVDEQISALAGVRQVLAGGDVLSPSHVQRLLDAMPSGHALINGYGPTENTTFTCCHRMSGGSQLHCAADKLLSVPIGRPVANTQVWVLDANRLPVPVGVPGELYVGGLGLAHGYLGRADLTAERFVPHPFAPGERLYRTGDEVRWLEDGSLEFLGRLDQQVKLRGFRIELGEIEAALRAHPAVRDSAVILSTGVAEDAPGPNSPANHAEPHLVAYLVPQTASQLPDAAGWRDFLRRDLPEYMLPAAFVSLAALPITANGKLDRRALPEPSVETAQVTRPDGNPVLGSLLQRRLLELWRQALNRPGLEIHDNFFSAGGHSLTAARLASQIQTQLGIQVHIASFFVTQTVADMAHQLEQSASLPNWSSLVVLQPEGPNRPLFYVHGFGGEVFAFLPMVRKLAPDQPVYGLQAVGLDGRGLLHNTLEEMAEHYARQILAAQPGPYRLSGYSLGGWIAWATADALIRQGAQVERIVMLDVFASAKFPWWINRLTQLASLASRWIQRAELAIARFKAWLAAPHFSVTRMIANAFQAQPADKWPDDRFFLAHQAYKPSPLPVKVEVLTSMSSESWEFWFWRLYAQRGVRVHRMPIPQHLDFHKPAYAKPLAEAVRRILNER